MSDGFHRERKQQTQTIFRVREGEGDGSDKRPRIRKERAHYWRCSRLGSRVYESFPETWCKRKFLLLSSSSKISSTLYWYFISLTWINFLVVLENNHIRRRRGDRKTSGTERRKILRGEKGTLYSRRCLQLRRHDRWASNHITKSNWVDNTLISLCEFLKRRTPLMSNW